MHASIKNYRQSPRKVRLVADAVKGKSIQEAEMLLAHLPKRAAVQIQKLIKAAVAGAEAQGATREALVIERIEVNKGVVMKRFMPRAHGRAAPIRKRASHLLVTLTPSAPQSARAPKRAPKAKKVAPSRASSLES